MKHYRIRRRLGEGAMGEVYLARDEKLRRLVAIKVPREKSREAKERFLREARTAAALNHPGIVTIYELGETDETTFLEPGTPFIVMQYIEGQSLESLLEDGKVRLSYSQIAQIMMRVSEAACYAHTRGRLVHRDLKPGNILIDVEGNPHIIDFGLAAYKEWLRRRGDDVAGTQEYMAPEQICGETRDGRTDIWSLGVILYKLLTGRLPFSAEAGNLMYDIRYTDPEPPRQIDERVPRGLQEVCLKCLSKNVAGRYQTAGDLADALRPFVEPGRVWTVPHDPTPCFLDREEEIAKIREIFKHKQMVIVTGMPGVGKTQIAIQYAERYKEEYQFVLWADASTPDSLMSHLLSFASVLNLPVRATDGASLVLDAVHHWLRSHDNWLLILDNVEELDSVQKHLPTGTAGHMLLTSRNPVVGGIDSITVDKLDEAKGTLLLLRRAGLLASSENPDDAQADDAANKISQALGGLPLALDQAGAFMEEMPCSPAEYIGLYESRGAELRDRRGDMSFGHPLSVATTFAISFAKIQEISPVAADLLCVLSFLSPESIPEELLLTGAPCLGENIARIENDQLALLEAIKVARRFSLIQRRPVDKTLSIHGLVQEVLRDRMDLSAQRMWAERTVQAISTAFPEPEDYPNWPSCDRLLPHALKAVSMIKKWHLESPEIVELLNGIGYHLLSRGRYAEAEPILRLCVELCRRILDPSDPDMAIGLGNLASALSENGRVKEAEPLYRESLRILEAAYRSPHSSVASALDGLGVLLYKMNCMEEAERLLRQALEIEERLGASDRGTARALRNLAGLLTWEGRYAEAEGLIRRALAIDEQLPQDEREHPDVASHLRGLASLLVEMECFQEAKPLLEQALAVTEKVFGSNHPDVAHSLRILARLLICMGSHEQAEPLLRRAIQIESACLGPDHYWVVAHRGDLGILLMHRGRTEEAEVLLRETLEVTEVQLGRNHPDVADCLTKLARLFLGTGRYEEAESLLQRALRIDESAFGQESPRVADRLTEMASCFCESGQDVQTKPLLQRSLRIREASLGSEHPKVAANLRSLADMLRAAGRYEGAEPLLKRALTILQKWLGDTNPITTVTLRDLGAVLDAAHRHEAARLLMLDALKRDEAYLGPNHSRVGDRLNDLAGVLIAMKRYDQSEPLLRRALAIQQSTPPGDPMQIIATLRRLSVVLAHTSRLEEAEYMLRNALDVSEKSLGRDHRETVAILFDLARLLQKDEQRTEAALLLTRALETARTSLPSASGLPAEKARAPVSRDKSED